jgi:hypothetical protein
MDRGIEHVLPGHGAIDVAGDQDGVETGEAAGFGRREPAEIDAGEDEYRHEQRGTGAACHSEKAFELEASGGRNAHAQRHCHDEQRHQQRDQQSRQEPGGKQLGDRLLGGGAIEDHGDAGRDHDVDRARRADQAG